MTSGNPFWNGHARPRAPALRRVGIQLLASAVITWLLVWWLAPVQGLRMQRFDNANWEGTPSLTALDKVIFFNSNNPLQQPRHAMDKPVSFRWDGFLDVVREYDVTFHLYSDDGSRLYVDGALVVDNSGNHAALGKDANHFLTPGLHPIRLEYSQAGGDAIFLLEWRSPLSFAGMRPLTPALLRPDGAPDTWWRVALRLLAALLTATGLLLTLAHQGLAALWRPGARAWRQAVAWGGVVFLVAAAFRLFDLNGAGETWDEEFYLQAGFEDVRNVLAGIWRADAWRLNNEHPPVAKFLYGACYALFGADDTWPRAGAALVSALTAALLFATTRRLLGLETAVLAGLLLAFLPPVVAHGKVAGMEAPTAFFMMLTVHLFFRASWRRKHRNAGIAWTLVALGMAVATKFSAALLVPWVGLGILVVQWPEMKRRKTLVLPWTMYLAPLLSGLPLLLLWPWLWDAPWERLKETLGHWNYAPREVFMGAETSDLPATYYLHYLGATVPVGLFPFLLLGMGALVLVARSKVLQKLPAGALGTPGQHAFLVLFWLLAPLGWSFSPLKQDGVRYIYAVFMPVAAVSALGMVVLARFLAARAGDVVGKWLSPALSAALVAYVASCAVGVHPFYLDYFNEAVGGPKGVFQDRRLEFGWWGEGAEDALRYVNSVAPQGASVAVEGNPQHFKRMLRRDLRLEGAQRDYVVRYGMSPSQVAGPEGYRQVYARMLQGAPVALVFKRP